MNDKSNIQPRAKIMWYFEPRIERKKSRYRSTFLVRLLGSKYFIILALVGYLLYRCLSPLVGNTQLNNALAVRHKY